MDFEALWNQQSRIVEPPNRRGAGSSSVAVVEHGVLGELGVAGRLYLKRQQAFYCRPPWNGFRRTPTLRRERRFIELARALGVAVPNVVLYAEGSADRAVLVTQEIEGAADLERTLASADARERATVLQNVSALLVRLHRARILHGAVYPKHLLVERQAPRRAWLIDFEKARRVVARAAEQDLARLLRHAPFINEADLDALLSAYSSREFARLRRRLEATRKKPRSN